MRVEHIRTLAGPNVYTYRPALLMRLHLEELDGRESRDLPGFAERLLSLLPGLAEHHCSKGRAGGFVERLREGTYFGHVAEHVAIELTNLAGCPVNHGRTRSAGEPGVYNVVVEYTAEHATRYLLGRAVELVEALAAGRGYAVEEVLGEARRMAAHRELGPSTRSIVEAAERRGIPWARVGEGSLVRLGWGKHRRFVQAAVADSTSCIAVELSCDKGLTKQLLDEASVPVPEGRTVRTEEEAQDALEELGAPVVIKPLDGRQGLGVSLNLRTADQVSEAFRIAREFSPDVLVEELFEGKNYRVLVVGGRMVAASERVACHVTGDGRSTVQELIEIANRDPRRGEGHEKPLTKIVVDDIVLAYLRKRGLSLADVPARGEVIYLREGVNLSTGGEARDVTDDVHPTVARLCERAALVAGLDICGVDLVLKDISRPFAKGEGGVIELNASPGLRMHLFPSEGRRREVGEAIIDLTYPPGAPARIPLCAVTGTNGKTTVTRMIGHVLGASGATVGVTTTDGIYVGGACVAEGDTTGPQSARTVLSDPTVDIAVLETARGGIMRRGLGYDWSDVAVLTNIQPDHFGQDGIEDLDDLVYVKSLVAERVRDGGTLVLNADDERLARLAEEPRVEAGRKRVVYFSLREHHLLVRRHVSQGGTAYVLRDGWAVEVTPAGERHLFKVASVPATLGGTADFQMANVLAACAAARAMGATEDQLAALATFRGDRDNPGRFNLFRVAYGGYVVMDYAHNPEALRAVAQMVARWDGYDVTGVVTVPGDRGDELIKEAGRIAARGFRRLVIREDDDPRGRGRGEVARMLYEAATAEVPGLDCRITLDERESLEHELRTLRAGQVLVMFYDKLKPLLSVLERYGAEPVSAIEGLRARAAAGAEQSAPLLSPPYVEPPVAAASAAGKTAARTRFWDGERDAHGYTWR